MPRIHARALFHFTDEAGLIGILQSSFRASFSKERLPRPPQPPWDYWVPMVCFCDIPLHLISGHINHYGHFGLGLSREWAIRSRLNPVLYFQPESLLFAELDSLMTLQHDDFVDLAKHKLMIESVRSVYLKSRYLLQYYKPWFGHDFRSDTDRSFYDEREWRYVPLAEQGFEAIYDDSPDFPSKRDAYFAQLKSPYLDFEPKDINYVVVHKDSHRYDMVQKIRSLKDKSAHRDVETLVSKIITVEQIEDDI